MEELHYKIIGRLRDYFTDRISPQELKELRDFPVVYRRRKRDEVFWNLYVMPGRVQTYYRDYKGEDYSFVIPVTFLLPFL